jgi:hypothetical protein
VSSGEGLKAAVEIRGPSKGPRGREDRFLTESSSCWKITSKRLLETLAGQEPTLDRGSRREGEERRAGDAEE